MKMRMNGLSAPKPFVAGKSLSKLLCRRDQMLFYFKDVALLDGSVSKIIVTASIHEFRCHCIDLVFEKKRRVCASGSPGVDKSTTMMYLIRLLVEAGIRVVYLERSVDKSGFYYEWKKRVDESICSRVYPEGESIEKIIEKKTLRALSILWILVKREIAACRQLHSLSIWFSMLPPVTDTGVGPSFGNGGHRTELKEEFLPSL
jgi:hypothetical protein